MVKEEKRAREKRLVKKRESLLERAKEHRLKAQTEPGRKDTTREYWLGEAGRFEEQAKQAQEMIDKLDKADGEAIKRLKNEAGQKKRGF